MDLKQSLLFKQVKMGEFFNEFPVRPAILIEPLQFVKSRETQHLADTHMDQILLFLLGKPEIPLSQLLNTDQKEHSIEVFWPFSNERAKIIEERVPFPFQFEISLKHAATPPSTQTLA